MKFKYLLLIIFSFSVTSCEKETECIIIQDKYGGNGAFYFQWDRTTRGNTEMQIGTGSVSENIFNQYDIGDIYCIEELML
tara:strand:- start:193 stop:432 length:240 start_codon:yes stop_codon:yes gene_type:complete